ncbi:hypothetical protein PICMEDRAFT_40880, partial [Pichia membranifaciens NRRL Y-2026]
MSADYWLSSQRMHFQYTKDQLNSLRFNILLWEKQKVTNNSLMIRYDTSMRIFIHHMIARLGRRLSLRQIILSTAEVYVSRFLIKVSLLEINIYMLVATSVYVACKICESPQHIRTILAEARNCWPEFISGDFTKIAEFEFYLIEELDCYLIVHHPYNSLAQLRNCQYRLNLTDSEIESVWQVINDSYMTDLPLLYPPHIIAIAALHIQLGMRRKLSQSMSHTGRVLPRSGSAGASTTTAGNMAMSLSPEKSAGGRPGAAGAPPVWNARLDAFTNFLAGSNVNLEEVIESVQELLNLYEAWQAYDEGAIRQTVKNVLM